MLTEEFKVRYDELDPKGAIPITTFLKYFQEAAALGAASMGYGWEQLQARNLAWIVTHMQVEILQSDAGKQPVYIRTWHAFSDKILSRREFEATDRNGTVLARGSSWWVLMDVQKRRITRNPQELLDANPAAPVYVQAEEDFKRPLPPSATANPLQLATRLGDIDINGHINNTRYSAWALESVPESVRTQKRLHKLFITFKNECRHPDEIVVSVYPETDSSFWHVLTRSSDGKEAARVYTAWK